MSNRNPNTSGITHYWEPGVDARCLLETKLLEKGFDPHGLKDRVDAFLDALMAVVNSNERCSFIGIGTFSWSPWRAHLPGGKKVETWHLAFKPCRYKEKYNGNR